MQLCRRNVGATIYAENEKIVKEKINFWREVLRRIINVIVTMAIVCLAFRGHEEIVGNGISKGGNFLGFVMMQARLDTFLQEIINSPRRTICDHPAPIQNEIIKLIAKVTRNSLVEKMKC